MNEKQKDVYEKRNKSDRKKEREREREWEREREKTGREEGREGERERDREQDGEGEVGRGRERERIFLSFSTAPLSSPLSPATVLCSCNAHLSPPALLLLQPHPTCVKACFSLWNLPKKTAIKSLKINTWRN